MNIGILKHLVEDCIYIEITELALNEIRNAEAMIDWFRRVAQLREEKVRERK